MGRREQCAQLIRQGKTPQEIATELQLTHESVIDYLYRAVGHNLITLSDIVLTWTEVTRKAIEDIIKASGTDYWFTVWRRLENTGNTLSKDDLLLYLQLRGTYIGDLYFMLSHLEVSLHRMIREVLQKEFVSSKVDWWKSGVPKGVREKCEDTHAKSGGGTIHPYCYATFIQLAAILKAKWTIFEKYLPVGLVNEKKRVLSALDSLNKIRNRVMHPLNSGLVQDDQDFILARNFYEETKPTQWRFASGS